SRFVWSIIIFFFSSRRRHTRFSRDWSSDVCSSDLGLSGCWNCRDRDECGSKLHASPAHDDVPSYYLAAWNYIAAELKDGGVLVKIGRASCRERGEIAQDGEVVRNKREVNHRRKDHT